MTFLPDRANCAQRDLVSGFCSSPRISVPSNRKSTCRKPRLGSSANRVTLSAYLDGIGVFHEGSPPDFNKRFFERAFRHGLVAIPSKSPCRLRFSASRFNATVSIAVQSSASCCLSFVPVFPLVRIRNIAAHSRVVMDEHAAYAQGHIVMDASDNRASAPAFFARRVPRVPPSFFAAKEPLEHASGIIRLT